MNHRNKIQSLVSPTDDPGDAPDCMSESGPCTWNMAISAINRPIFENKGFPGTNAGFCHPSAAKTAQKHASLKIWPQQENGKKSPKLKELVKKWKNIFEKIRSFSALDERDCQATWLFAHWGQFGRERRAWPNGADPPIFHMHRGKIGQIFRIRVFPEIQVGLCVDGPARPLGTSRIQYPGDTIHFPLAVAGSQSALYWAVCPYGLCAPILLHH